MKAFGWGGAASRAKPGATGFYGAMGRLGEKPLVMQFLFFATVGVLIAADDLAERALRAVSRRRPRR